MKRTTWILLLIAFILSSCSSTLHKIFNPTRTAHEQYAENLEERKLNETAEGRQWLLASKKALANPVTIELPYKQIGHFQFTNTTSLGLRFRAKQGERITFAFSGNNTSTIGLFADLFKVNNVEGSPFLSFDFQLVTNHF